MRAFWPSPRCPCTLRTGLPSHAACVYGPIASKYTTWLLICASIFRYYDRLLASKESTGSYACHIAAKLLLKSSISVILVDRSIRLASQSFCNNPMGSDFAGLLCRDLMM